MKPVKLTLKNFGSYRDETVIDFTKMGKKGLFLIFGDNGAGKSTIYDAICYSLYGSTSGDSQSRSSDMLRNTAAAETDETFTELIFTHLGLKYTVRRSMKYKRPSQRGNGLVDQPGDTILTLPDGTQLQKVKADEEIAKILGVKAEQFKQIMMIAQGAFSKFLFADSNGKKKILSGIFKTKKFEKLQETLKDRCSKVRDIRDEKASRLRSECVRINLPKEEESGAELQNTAEELRNLINNSSDKTIQDILPRIKELLDELIRLDTDAADEISEELTQLSKESAVLNQRYADAEKAKENEKALEAAKEYVRENGGKLSELKTASEKTRLENSAKIEQNQTRIGMLEGTLDNYNKLDSSKENLRIAEEGIKKETANKADYKQQQTRQSEEKERFVEREKELNDALRNESAKTADAESCKGQLAEIRKVLDIEKQLTEQENMLNAARNEYNNAQNNYDTAAAESKRLSDAFFRGQAGIMAENLDEGTPCPVCGSCTHPAKAVKHADIPTEKELKEAQEKAEQLQDIRNRKANIAGSIQAVRNEKLSEFRAKAAEILNKDISKPQEAVSEIEILKKSVQEKANQIAAELSALQAARKEYDQLRETKIPECERQIQDLKQLIQTAELNLNTHETNKKAAQQTIEELTPHLTHAGRKEAEAEINSIRECNKELNSRILQAEENYTQLKTKIDAANGKIESLEKQLEATKIEDIENLKKRLKEIQVKQDELSSRNGVLHGRNATNTNIRVYIQKSEEDFRKTDNEFIMVEPLSRAANGKLAFSSFVLANYLDQIMNRTNDILLPLSEKFVLRRKDIEPDGRKSYGLDLSVINTHSGKEQETKSLSGGESFMVSLALALGFAEEVRETARGAKMESMFIDEGFGTLSEENIQKAVQLLNELAGEEMLIGVISHVESVTEGIPKRIHITRENGGRGGSKVTIEV